MFISPSSPTLSSTLSTSGTVSGNFHSTSTPSSYTYFPLGSRSPPPSELPPAMPPSGAVGYRYYLGARDVVDSSSQSGPSVSAPSDSPRPTSTSAGLDFTSTPTKTLPFPTILTTQTFSSPAPVSSSHSTGSPLPSLPVFASSAPPSTSSTTESLSAVPTTVVFLSTVVTSFNAPSALISPYTPTYTITSVLLGQEGTITVFVTPSQALSTENPGNAVNSTLSPGTIAAIVLGIVGAFAFSALWLFCARRRQRTLLREAALTPPENHVSGPLDDEILDMEELGFGSRGSQGARNSTTQTGPLMEQRYAGILAALHSTEWLGRGNEGGSTGGIYGSRHDIATDMDGDDDLTRASSPTLPLHVLPPDDPPYTVPLSPPPVSQPSHYQSTQPAPPPSAYNMTTRRKSSPGPDAAGWLGGYGVVPSYNSHYARSQTLGSGSGSGSGSVDALSRTRTGSEEPLLGIGKATPEVSAGVSTLGGVTPTTATDPGSNRLGLGSAFGSPAGSMHSPSTIYAALHDSPGSYGTRTASGSGSYGYARSGTPSTFDVLRSVSSQGALSSAYSHGRSQSQGFKFGFSRAGSLSSGSKFSFGVPPTSFRAWKDQGSASSDKDKEGEKQSLQEKDRKPRPRSWTSASNSGSVDEKQGRGSPVMGVRALFGRLRRAGHTPSPHSSSRDLSSPTQVSMDVNREKAAADRAISPPIEVEAATPQRRRFSFILSNPDPNPPSPFTGAGDVLPASDTPPHQELCPIQYEVPLGDPHGRKPVSLGDGGLPATPLSIGYVLVSAPSPAPTEESHLAEGLLHPRLQAQGFSDASLRDFEDYSRPIGGIVKNRLYSTTTFGTQDDASPSRGTPVQDIVPSDEHDHEEVDVFGSLTHSDVPRSSWFVDDLPPPARRSPGP